MLSSFTWGSELVHTSYRGIEIKQDALHTGGGGQTVCILHIGEGVTMTIAKK